MKNKIAVMIIVNCFLSSKSFSALPSMQPLEISIHEIISMPLENQISIVSKDQKNFYKQALDLAKDNRENLQTRWSALMLASAIDPNKIKTSLDEFFSNKDWYMRNAALVVASKYHPDLAIQNAKKLLKDKALVVRSAAVEVLAKDNSSEVRQALWQELYSPNNYRFKKSLWIREKIVNVLSKQPENSEAQKFQELLSETNSLIQQSSLTALEKIFDLKFGKSDSLESRKKLWLRFAKSNLDSKN